MFSCEFCEIFKNTFFHKTPPVAAFAANEICFPNNTCFDQFVMIPLSKH